MKAVKITLAGREQYLAYTGEAMFQLQEKFGTAAELLGAIGKNTREGLSVACEAAAILAEQGELARRYLGYDKGPIIDAETIRATITPGEIAALKLAIPAAMELGYGRDVVEDNDEVDLGLAELNAQKKRPDPRQLRADRGLVWSLTERVPPHAPGRVVRYVGALAPSPREKASKGRLRGRRSSATAPRVRGYS